MVTFDVLHGNVSITYRRQELGIHSSPITLLLSVRNRVATSMATSFRFSLHLQHSVDEAPAITIRRCPSAHKVHARRFKRLQVDVREGHTPRGEACDQLTAAVPACASYEHPHVRTQPRPAQLATGRADECAIEAEHLT